MQATRDIKLISSSGARAMADACTAWAEQNKQIVAMAVLDWGGNLIEFHAMDGAPMNAIDTALLKAKSALRWRRPTSETNKIVRSGENLAPTFMNDFPQPGALPVVVNGCAEGEGGRDRINGSSENHRNRSYRLAIHNVAAAEALVLGMKAGLDGAQVLKLVGEGAGSSRILQLRGPMMVKGRYRPPTMTLANFEKDLAIIAAFARKVGARTPLFSAAAPIYAAAIRKDKMQDTAAVCAVIEKMAGRFCCGCLCVWGVLFEVAVWWRVGGVGVGEGWGRW